MYEGEITKINKIIFNGNNSIFTDDLKGIIQSKTKSIVNIFANNNFKPIKTERDEYTIVNHYKNNGFLDVNVETQIEYLKSNKVNIYFIITEGKIYSLSSLKIIDEKNLLDSKTLDIINQKVDLFFLNQTFFSIEKIKELEKEISTIIIKNGVDYFEINLFEKKENKSVEVLFQINSITPKYTNQINIIGNSITKEKTIRSKILIEPGDYFNKYTLDKFGENVESCEIPGSAVDGADVVTTDVWASMGDEHENEERKKVFKSFQVNMNLMSKATENAIFLHCLPAHRGEEIDDTIIDSSYSVVWQQAHNRLYSSMALIDFLLSSSKN